MLFVVTRIGFSSYCTITYEVEELKVTWVLKMDRSLLNFLWYCKSLFFSVHDWSFGVGKEWNSRLLFSFLSFVKQWEQNLWNKRNILEWPNENLLHGSFNSTATGYTSFMSVSRPETLLKTLIPVFCWKHFLLFIDIHSIWEFWQNFQSMIGSPEF